MNKLFIVVVLVIALGIIFVNFKKKSSVTQDEVWKSIEEFENRKKYAVLTKEIISSIPDEELEQALIDFVLEQKIKNDYTREFEIVKSLSNGFQYVYATWLLEAEVNNGGFNQYFYNSAGQFQNEALEGLRNFGATETEKLLTEAIQIYIKEKPMHDETKKKGTLEAFSESYEKTELNRLDDQFYSSNENISDLRIKYIKDHVEEFINQ